MELRKLGKILRKLERDQILESYEISTNGCTFKYLGVVFRCHCEQYTQVHPLDLSNTPVIVNGPMSFYVNYNIVSYWEITDKKDILKIKIIP